LLGQNFGWYFVNFCITVHIIRKLFLVYPPCNNAFKIVSNFCFNIWINMHMPIAQPRRLKEYELERQSGT